MPTPREGSYAGTHGIHSSPAGLSSGNTQTTGRVLYTLLTDDPKQLSKMHVPSGSIGAIQFKMLYNGQEDKSDNFLVAYPLGHIRKYPLPNELVNIVTSASNKSSNPLGNNTYTYYYDDILPVFDSPEHNALPTDTSFSGSNNTSVTGPYFKEKGSIYKLQHLPGDTTIEGRFGNSIRIGASNNLVPESPWKGEQGSPVLVIANGHKTQTASNISATFEDVNGDGSTLMALKGHSILFKPASTLFDSYGSQSTSTDTKNNIIVVNSTPTTTSSIPAQVADKVPITDTVPTVYQTNTPPATVKPIADEPLPTKEDNEDFNVEFEDFLVPHQGLNQQRWIDALSKVDISTYDPDAKFDLSGNFDPLFLTYMAHNQGGGGIKAILYYAKQGALKIPMPTKYLQDLKYDIESVMWGRVKNPYSVNKGNVSLDFKKYYGTDFTPTNFLKYWNAKVAVVYKKVGSKPTSLDTYFKMGSDKYGVSMEYMRTIASLESSFNPNEGSHDKNSGPESFKGLFQINLKQFQSVYPGDTDIYNPMKNSIAGAKALSKAKSETINIIQSLN